MNTTVSFKDLFDLSVVFMQNAFEICCHYLLMLHAHETMLGLDAVYILPTSTMLAAVQADHERPLSSRLSIHCCRNFC